MESRASLPTLRAGDVELRLNPGHGGRVASLRIGGREVLVTAGASSLLWGLYPMAPWAGRLRDGRLHWRGATHAFPVGLVADHAIHGTLLDRAWDLERVTDDTADVVAALDPPWPFGGRVEHHVQLAPDHLTLRLTITSEEGAFPAIVGWHPWFPRTIRDAVGSPAGGAVEIDLPAGGMLVRGPDGLPTGEVRRPPPPGPWDDCFVDVARPPVVRWPGALSLALSSDARYWVCYTQLDHAVCVEPQTGPPDGLNTGDCAVVEPGQPHTATMELRWSEDPAR